MTDQPLPQETEIPQPLGQKPVYGNEGRTSSPLIPIIIVIIAFALFAGLGYALYKTYLEPAANPQQVSCTYNGVVYDNGAAFVSADGCNSCACNNGQAICTLRACAFSPTPSEDLSTTGNPTGSITVTPSAGATTAPDFSNGNFQINVYLCNNNNPEADWTITGNAEFITSVNIPDTTTMPAGSHCYLKTFKTDLTNFTMKVTRAGKGSSASDEKLVDSMGKPYIYIYFSGGSLQRSDYEKQLELSD